MRTRTHPSSRGDWDLLRHPPDFSLVLGGPLFQLMRRAQSVRRCADEPLVGSADIQSLADLGNSCGVVQDMRIVPVTRDALLRLVAATLAPIVPLGLTMMSLEDLLKKLMGVLF
jgi:hypothetical protein